MRFYHTWTNRRHNSYGSGTLAGYTVHTRGWNAGVAVTPRGEKGEPDSFDVVMTSGRDRRHDHEHPEED